MRVVVFTALFADHGSKPIDLPRPFEKMFDWDYVMITNLDRSSFPSNISWTIKTVDHPTRSLSRGQNIYANRYYKWKPWLLNASLDLEYDLYIYVDAFQAPDHRQSDVWLGLANLAVNSLAPTLVHCKHPCNTCIYEECDAIVTCRKDTRDNMERVVSYLQRENMPKGKGLFWNGCYVLSKSSVDIVKPIWNALWEDMCKLTYRDQSLYMLYVNRNMEILKPIIKMVDLDKLVIQTDTNTNHVYV